jgi:hypothetical protein
MRRILFALIVLVAAAAAAGWWFRSRGVQSPPAAASGASPASRAAATQPARPPLPPAGLTLEIDGGPNAQVARGEAMFFIVSLTGTSPAELRVGAAGQPWSARLRFESAEGKPFPARIEQLGRPLAFRFDRSSATSEESDEAVVSASRGSQVGFGMSPDEAARIEGGTHTLRAVLSLEPAIAGRTEFVSNTVRFTVRMPPDMGGNPFPDAKPRLRSAARFYLRAEKWDDAHRIALQLVQRDDVDGEAYTLLADALNGLQRNDEALAAYRAALASLPAGTQESPDYLFARIDQLEERIGAAKGKKQ